MGIKQTLDVINEMEKHGVIGRYAIGGAVAAYNYIEPAVTEDLDILISFEGKSPSKLISLDPILAYLKARGYSTFSKEGISIEGWPVQFLPVSDALDVEALAAADKIDVRTNGGKAKARVLKPEHLVALALRLGRPKDLVRIAQFLQERAVPLAKLKALLERHKLEGKWRAFCAKTRIRDPLAAK